MALAQSRKQGAKVYGVRVGPKKPGATRYIVGFTYPPKPVGLPVGTFVDANGAQTLRAHATGVVVAPQAIALIGRGPRLFGWPHNEVGLAAARDVAKRITAAIAVRVRDWRGGPM